MTGPADAVRDPAPASTEAAAGSTESTESTESTDAAPAVVEQAETPGVDRTTDRRLARLHLRTGARALARVELESLAGVGGLDDEALLDLAEVRWRTDDLTGAGEAAAAYLASGREAPLALVIVAEATAALGRPSEARRLAGRAVELIDGPLDPIFAGMPRSAVWPVQPVEAAQAVSQADAMAASPADAMAAPRGRDGSVVAIGIEGSPDPMLGLAAAPASPGAVSASAAATGFVAAATGFVAATTTRADTRPDIVRTTASIGPAAEALAMPDPAAELAGARAALIAGDRDGAAVRLAVVLRLAPALAPAVLDIAAAEPGPAFDLVRGDALRLVGRESQARRSFAAAARSSTPVERPPTGDPAPDQEPEPDR